MARARLILMAAGAALTLTACGDSDSTPAYNSGVDQQNRREQNVGRIGDLLSTDALNGAAEGAGAIPVNKYLWQASLQTLQFLPLASTDPFTGVIATDWSVSADNPQERFKVAVFIDQPQLVARALRVAVYRETLAKDGTWISAEVSQATPRRLEDTILTKARQLRVADLENGAE